MLRAIWETRLPFYFSKRYMSAWLQLVCSQITSKTRNRKLIEELFKTTYLLKRALYGNWP